MPTVERETLINAPPALVFALSQDYGLRLEWDPFLRELRFLEGATKAAVGVKVWVRARSGLTMTVVYTVVDPPERVAMSMLEGPWLFDKFAGSWIFRPIENQTQVTFRYGFTVRPGFGWLAVPAITRIFSRDIRLRLRALKHAAETTDILSRLSW
jgi:ribosome-associated toxin RatA of RatAB toxin-antitoxin module